MFYPEPQPRMQGICQPSDSPFWGLVPHSFYTTDEAHVAAQGPVFFSHFPRFLLLALCMTPLTLNPRGARWHTGLRKELCLAGCEQLSSSLSFQVCPSCRRAFPSGCTLTLTEPENTWQLPPSIDSPAVLGERSLYGRYLAESIFQFLFSSPFWYFPNLHSSHEHIFLAFAGWGF